MSAQKHLQAVLDAERALREAEAALLDEPEKAVVDALESAVKEAKSIEDLDEATLRLERLADLCAQVPGPRMADALIAILDHDEPRVRVSAGEALLDVAYDYYAEVARAIDRTLDDGRAVRALAELPFLLAEVGEPSATPLLRRFLAHPDATVVAAAIEAAVELGDPELASSLESLADDEREVAEEDFEEETAATLGDLATDALEALRGRPEPDGRFDQGLGRAPKGRGR
ncbi:MAG: HEAT repeat domain-containing protein [Sandaracinus sp.]|nr:HEAT repeat domain-containing protein [Myxococcales bacterium]MCB9632552.1 HEAT repeat domain-containing protein [Sandaracinus sp.]